MKKKLILSLSLVIALVCLFAIGASAAGVTEATPETEVTLTDGTVVPLYDENGEGLIWFIKGTDENGANIYDSVVANNNTADNATNYVTYTIDSKYGTNQMHDIYIKVWNAETSAYDSIAENQIVVVNFRTFTREYRSFGTIFNNNIEYVYHSATTRNSGDFTGYTNLQILDASLTTNFEAFGEQAFKGCTALREVRIGNSETGYGLTCQNGNLFNGATSLTKVWLADISDVTSIGVGAFYNCYSLTGTYTFPSVTTIENQAFRSAATNEDTNLILNFPSVEKIGTSSSDTHVFSYSGVTEITFGDDVSHMSFNTFTSCTRLWRIEFAGVADGFNFPSYTFDNCSALKAFSIPEGMTKLPSRMFKSCSSLTAIYLPSTLTTIESGSQDHATFANCTNAYFVSSPFKYTKEEDIPAKEDVYYFPSGITSIASGEVFKQCRNLNKTLVFPVGVKSMTNQWAFEAGISNPTLENIVFLGDMDSVSTGNWKLTGKIYFANANDKSSADFTSYSNSKSTVFCNAEGNTTHLHNPKADATLPATCTAPAGAYTYCFCGEELNVVVVEGSKALGHKYDNLTGKYYPAVSETNEAPNYFANAMHQYFCSQCNENVEKEEPNTNLFTEYGYSVSEEDSSFVSYIVYANANLISAYAEYKGVDVKYGLVVSASPSGTPLTYADGKLVADATTVKVEMSGTSYNKLTVLVTNVPADMALHCNGYIAVDGAISYLNHKVVENTAATVTHTDIIALIKEQNQGSGDEETVA